ncbi:COG1361 family protein [Thermofilum pendens]|nr:hypothetical protein [Thermofilum pendens]
MKTGPVLLLIAVTVAATLVGAGPVTVSPSGSARAYAFVLEDVSVLDSGVPSGVVQVSVSYYGAYTLLGASLGLTARCGGAEVSAGSVDVGSWRPGTVKTARFTLNTSSLGSECTLRVSVSWGDSWDDAQKTYTGLGGSTSLEYSFTACWGERVSVGVRPQMVYSSTVNPVLLVVENSGRTALRQVEVYVAPQGSVLLNASVPTVFELGDLKPGERRVVPLSVVPQSPFPSFSVTVSYLDCSGSKKSVAQQVYLYAAAGQSIVVVPDPPVLVAGQASNVSLRVVNAGGVAVKGLSLVLGVQKSPLSVSPSFLVVGDLGPGESRSVPVTVLVPATASSSESVAYQALYSVEGGGLATSGGSFTFYVAQRSSVSITSVDVVPQSPEVGSNVIFAVSLVDDGTFPVYAVNVSAYASRGLSPLRSTYAYLGQLNPQVLTTVPFSFRAVEEGMQEVRFVVTYRDAYGYSRSAERTVYVNVARQQPSRQAQGGSANPYVYLAAVAVALLLAAAYAARKRRG